VKQHGHFHNGAKVKGNQINVNMDTWDFKLVSESEIVKMTGTKNYLKNKVTGLIKKLLVKVNIG
jgi:calcineurin-like phosphoesterase family protein